MNKEEYLKNIFNEKFDFEDNRYFYHITSSGTGEILMETGLGLCNHDMFSTMIEITPDMIKNPMEFLDNELGFGVMGREEMVIIGCDNDEVDSLVHENTGDLQSWNQDEGANYIVSANHILGYFDLRTKELYENDNYDYENNHNYGCR